MFSNGSPPDSVNCLRICARIAGSFRRCTKRVDAALVILRRDDRAQRSRGPDVRILIGGNIDAAVARACSMACNDLRHLAPVLLAGNLQVKDFDWDIGLAADAKGFIQSIHLRIAFVADVRSVDAALGRRRFGERDQAHRFSRSCRARR